MRTIFMLLGAAGLAFSACEKSSAPTTPPPGDTAGSPGDSAGDSASGDTAGVDSGDATEPGAPGVKWADKTDKQRKEYMGTVVLPQMKTVFQAHDGAAFGTFKCETCHGKSGKDNGFKMPNESMYPLDKADPIKGAMEYDEKITKFMMEQVTPKMAEMLDSPVYSPETPDGVGCFTCHPAG